MERDRDEHQRYYFTISLSPSQKFLKKKKQQQYKTPPPLPRVEILHDDRDHETIDRRLFSTGASCRAPRVAFFL
jgi:hypothetical protein